MIYFDVNIRNPYWFDRFKNIRHWAGETPVKHKYWEIEIIKCPELFRFGFEITTRQDHAGARLDLGLLGYEIDFKLYDNRHWNWKEGRWN